MSAPSSPLPFSVVIVEDNATTNGLLREWLVTHFNVSSFLDAETALKELKPSAEPTAFVVDYNLPGMNGLELRAKLTPSFPHGKYILISGLFDEKLTRDAREAGYDVNLPKPFPLSTLLKKVQELLGIESPTNLVDLVKHSKEQA
jgi:two-component system, LuxR family, response regulator FixJ